MFQSKTSIFHDEETSFTSLPSAKKARTALQLSPKFTMVTNKTKKRRDKHTAKIWSDQHIQNSNFRFKSLEKRSKNAHEVR
jgi:hypothetical protein